MSVPEFFQGKSIFITGGAGFIGKALIEKLLRSCSGVKTIYLLLREKKGVSPKERIKAITDLPLFDVLKKQDADAIKKLVPISGDVSQLQLGISNNDRQMLIENINIVYHAAASVKFDDPLKDAIILNTRGAREITDLALHMKNLEAFIHISTTYCHTDKDVIEEKIYPTYADWRDAISIAENCDPTILDIFMPKYTKPFPNTYTFAKSLGEQVVNDMCKGNIPCVIFRPSIVVCSIEDPIPGWLDNFNGPIGLLAAGGKGLVKATYGLEDLVQDLIPIDLLLKMLIITTSLRIENKDLNEIIVVNGSLGGTTLCSNNDYIKLGSKLTWDAPFKEIVWYPYFKFFENWYIYYIIFLLYHIIPAVFFDIVLKLSGHKPIIMRIQRKIYNASMALIYYTANSWHFVNDKMVTVQANLSEKDKQDFNVPFYFSEEQKYEWYKNGKIGVAKFILKEGYDREVGLKRVWRMWVLNLILHVVLFAIGCWFLIVKVGILDILYNKLINMYVYLVDLH